MTLDHLFPLTLTKKCWSGGGYNLHQSTHLSSKRRRSKVEGDEWLGLPVSNGRGSQESANSMLDSVAPKAPSRTTANMKTAPRDIYFMYTTPFIYILLHPLAKQPNNFILHSSPAMGCAPQNLAREFPPHFLLLHGLGSQVTIRVANLRWRSWIHFWQSQLRPRNSILVWIHGRFHY